MDPKGLALAHPLVTNACVIRRFRQADVEPLAGVLADEEAMGYLPFPKELRSAAGARLLISDTMARYETDNPALAYAAAELGCDRFLGFCGMNLLPDAEVELMYAVTQDRRGEGFGRMIASALVKHVLSADPRYRCVAFVHIANKPSIAILERLQFHRVGLVEHEMFPQPVLKFSS